MVASHLPANSVGRALIADDQPDVLAALRLLLKQEGLQTEAATSPAAVLEALESNDYDLVLMDLNYTRDTTSGREGLDLVSQIRALDSTLPVVVMTSWGTVDIAIERCCKFARLGGVGFASNSTPARSETRSTKLS